MVMHYLMMEVCDLESILLCGVMLAQTKTATS